MLYQLSHFRSVATVPTPPMGGAESQIRTGDTAIFSRVLYQLSYLGVSVRRLLSNHTLAWSDKAEALPPASRKLGEGLHHQLRCTTDHEDDIADGVKVDDLVRSRLGISDEQHVLAGDRAFLDSGTWRFGRDEISEGVP